MNNNFNQNNQNNQQLANEIKNRNENAVVK